MHGAGGGWASILRALDARGHGDVRVRLTDLYPNARAAERLGRGGRITYTAEPVDALTVPHDVPGIHTMLLSLHHFRPADAKRTLQRAVDGGHSIAIVDAPGRGLVRTVPGVTLPIMLAVSLRGNAFFPPLVLLMTPFVRPFRWSRFLFTYLIPIVPLYVWWDAAVSALRAYGLDEIRQLTQELESGTQFIWEIGRAGRRGPLGISYLIGYPRPNGGQQAVPAAEGGLQPEAVAPGLNLG